MLNIGSRYKENSGIQLSLINIARLSKSKKKSPSTLLTITSNTMHNAHGNELDSNKGMVIYVNAP